MINTSILKGKWSQLSGILKKNWSELTDDDLEFIAGDYDRLAGKLQEYYGYKQEEAKEKVQAFVTKFTESGDKASRNIAAILNNLTTNAKHTADKYSENIKQVSAQVDEQAKKSPWLLAGVAALVGLTVGLLL